MSLTRLSAVVFSALLLVASCKKPETLGPGAPPTAYPARSVLDQPFGDSSYMRMDLYFPDGYTRLSPVVFVVPDGGFDGGYKSGGTALAQKFTDRGFIAASINYIAADTQGVYYPDSPYHRPSNVHINHQVDDVRRAIITYMNASRLWGSGTSSMYVAGHGYGSALAMLYAFGPYNADHNVRAVASLAGVSDFTVSSDTPYAPKPWLEQKRLAELFYRGMNVLPLTDNNEAIKAFSPYWVAKASGGRPVISIYPEINTTLGLPGEAGRGYDQAVALDTLLGSQGLAHKLLLFPGADHEFNGGQRSLDDAVSEAAAFLKKQ